ncbi:MAG: hypothetical protein K2O67_02255 [Clostridia bacterium]|nr:hypothetical protein [Clostridia bacterium]
MIDNIVSFDEDGKAKFSKNNLDKLSKVVGYESIKKLADAAVKDSFNPLTSEDFYGTVVKFGEYEFDGVKHELVWIPVYVSNAEDEQGNKSAILTLWLANVGVQGTDSNQERISFSFGSGSNLTTYTEASTNTQVTVYANSYDGSFMRNYVLNGNDSYAVFTSNRPRLPEASSMTKFSLFTGRGALAGYIVEPKYVGWQMSETWYPSDPSYTDSKAEYYPSAWTGDKIWLPGADEVYDSNIWQTDTDLRANSENCWTRSARSVGGATMNLVAGNGNLSFQQGHFVSDVRPALHLNISALSVCEHSLVKHPAVSYCLQEGYEEYWQCSKCDSMFSDSAAQHGIDAPVVINPTGHDYSEAWSSNTDKHWHVCNNNCGVKGSEEEHTWDSGTVTEQPSCTQIGKKLLTCTTCGKTKTEDVPKSEHTYSSEWKYDSNNHWHECSVCHAVQPNSTVAHSGGTADCENKAECSICNQAYGEYGEHTPETIPAEDATCTEKGKTAGSKCSVCEEVLTAQSEIPALGHNFSITVSGTQPTCQEGGTATMKCSRCDETETQDSADPVDHVYTNYVSNGNATCTQNGTKTAECDFGCGATDTIEDEDSATGHTPGEEATCTTAQTCTVCDTELVAALGHDYQTAEGGVAPTCTEDGSGKLVCSRCDAEKEGDSIPALGHIEVTDEAKVPTCTETGLTEGKHCSRCEEILTAQEEVPALGHNYQWVITQEPTVEEPGLMENLCTVCGDIDGEEEIAKLIDPNGEIDLPVDINVEFKVTQSSTDNDYSDIDKGLKRGYWAQLWYRNEDGTLGDEFMDKINCFLTLKIPTDIIEAIRGGEEINRDKIAAGLKVYYIDGEGAPVEVNNFTIAMRDDDSWQIKFNYNEKFRAEVVFAADLDEQPSEPETTGIPWWVWLLVILGSATLLAIIIVIIVVAKKKKNDNTPSDNGEVLQRLDNQDQVLNELLNRGDDGGFNTPVELDENGNVIFK